jgi:hypothetical protein
MSQEPLISFFRSPSPITTFSVAAITILDVSQQRNRGSVPAGRLTSHRFAYRWTLGHRLYGPVTGIAAAAALRHRDAVLPDGPPLGRVGDRARHRSTAVRPQPGCRMHRRLYVYGVGALNPLMPLGVPSPVGPS